MPRIRDLASRRRSPILSVIAFALTVTFVAGCSTFPQTRAFGPAIEPTVPYQPASATCAAANDYDKPGPIQFRDLLIATYGIWVGGQEALDSISRPCDGTISEHAEGRALDWGMDYRNPAMRADGEALMHWLFATDKYGNADAMARRLGIMYVIWDYQIYGSWDGYQAAPYACGTDPVACHVTHMHFSFDWPGALAQTSFFTGKVS